MHIYSDTNELGSATESGGKCINAFHFMNSLSTVPLFIVCYKHDVRYVCSSVTLVDCDQIVQQNVEIGT